MANPLFKESLFSHPNLEDLEAANAQLREEQERIAKLIDGIPVKTLEESMVDRRERMMEYFAKADSAIKSGKA